MNGGLNFSIPGTILGAAWRCTPLILLLAILQFSAAAAVASNPLTGGTSPTEKNAAVTTHSPTTSMFSMVMARINLLQMQIKNRIAADVRNFKKESNITPLLPLFILTFFYGAVHAAGPGHGKAIAMTYILAKGKSYGSGLLLGIMIAISHAGSAILLVFLLKVILEATISANLASATHITQLVSYTMICLLGLYMLISPIQSRLGKKHDTSHDEKSKTAIDGPLTAAITIGIVPCPGVIMILLFCLSLDQTILGVLLCSAVSLGMALTITSAVWLTLAGKMLLFQVSSSGENRLIHTEQILHCLSGVILVSTGSLLLLASW